MVVRRSWIVSVIGVTKIPEIPVLINLRLDQSGLKPLQVITQSVTCTWINGPINNPDYPAPVTQTLSRTATTSGNLSCFWQKKGIFSRNMMKCCCHGEKAWLKCQRWALEGGEGGFMTSGYLSVDVRRTLIEDALSARNNGRSQAKWVQNGSF